MNAVSNPLTERVVIMTAAQVGKSEILLNVVGYFIDQEPSPILLIQQSVISKPSGCVAAARHSSAVV